MCVQSRQGRGNQWCLAFRVVRWLLACVTPNALNVTLIWWEVCACEALGIEVAKGSVCMCDPKTESLQFVKNNFDGVCKCFWESMSEVVGCNTGRPVCFATCQFWGIVSWTRWIFWLETLALAGDRL